MPILDAPAYRYAMDTTVSLRPASTDLPAKVHGKQTTAALSLLALGVVYGDIGTSPLYAVKETFNPEHGIALTAGNIIGGLSTIFWILMVVVSLKYVTLVLRADNRGEGGIMALLAMATASIRKHREWTGPLLILGVFGRTAVRIAWFGLVAPALVLNYFGQGALLIVDPKALENPFYLSYPSWALYPMVALATAATIIASQATISGAYSMTRQAIQLGYLPRMTVHHTSAKVIGQIYVPAVNWILLVAVAAAVVGFGSSTRLASAYGVAVMGTMLVTTFLTFFVIRYGWGYPLWLCLLATGFFMVIDVTLFGAALLKIHEGGWFPLALGAVVFVIMMTWRRGRQILTERLQADAVPLDAFLKSLLREPPERVHGSAVYLTATPDATPQALLHSLKHFQTLHERVAFLTIEFRDVPWIPFEERVVCERLGGNCWRVRVRYGFMNRPDVTPALEQCGALGLELEPMETSFFVSRPPVVPVPGPGR